MPPFSLIIITRDRVDQLQQCLESIQSLTNRQEVAETIVVDDGSQDSTPEYLASLAGIRHVRHEQARGPAASRNHGVSLATAPYCWFLDDDVAVSPGALAAYSEHVQMYPMVRASAVGPVEQMRDQRTSFEYWLCHGGSQFIHCFVDPSRRLDGGEEQFCTANLMAPTELLRAERFDESFRYPRYEDRELGYRLARKHDHKIHLVDGARVTHLKRYRFRDWLKAYRIFTECAMHFSRLHPQDQELRAKLHITRAENTPYFRGTALALAVRLLNSSHCVEFGEHGDAFGGAWMRDSVFGSYRTLQEFFRLSYLREALGLDESRDIESGAEAASFRDELLDQLNPDL